MGLEDRDRRNSSFCVPWDLVFGLAHGGHSPLNSLNWTQFLNNYIKTWRLTFHIAWEKSINGGPYSKYVKATHQTMSTYWFAFPPLALQPAHLNCLCDLGATLSPGAAPVPSLTGCTDLLEQKEVKAVPEETCCEHWLSFSGRQGGLCPFPYIALVWLRTSR